MSFNENIANLAEDSLVKESKSVGTEIQGTKPFRGVGFVLDNDSKYGPKQRGKIYKNVEA